MKSRKEILTDLIESRGEPVALTKQLAEFGWDASIPLARLELAHIINVLREFIDGIKSKEQVEDWANAIETREDIEFDAVTKNLIYLLANPELVGQELTVSWAKDVVEKRWPV